MGKPMTGTTKKGMAAKEKILDTALHLINEKGYAQTTMSDICVSAGIAHGTFYHYFKSKQDILLDYVQKESQDLLVYYDSLDKGSYAAALQRVLDYQADYFIRKGTEFVTNFYSLTLLSKNDYFKYHEFSLNAIIHDCFVQGQAKGEFRSDFPAYFMQELAEGLLYRITTLWCIGQGGFDLKTELHSRVSSLLVLCKA